MSDTDDTDVLLIIPPTFFHISSSGSDDSLLQSSRTVVQKPASCTAHVLGKIVDQVRSLENRLETLELSSEVSSSANSAHKTWDFERCFDSISITRKCSTFPRRRQRKNYSKKRPPKDLSITSFDSISTYQKSVPPLLLTKQPKLETYYSENIDDSPSMDGDLSSIVSTPSKKNDKLLLNEIDEFLTRVEAYESPETKYRGQDCLDSEDVIKAAGDYIAQKIDPNGGDDIIKLPSEQKSREVLDKYIYLLKNNPELVPQDKSLTSINSYNTLCDSGSNMNRESYSKPPDDKQKPQAEAKSPSVRKLNFLDSRKDMQHTSTPKRIAERSDNSFKPSSNKVYERASKVLEQYKQNHSPNQPTMSADTSYMLSPKKDEFKVPQGRPYMVDSKDCPKLSILRSKLLDTIDTELLSLSDLWGDKKENIDVTNLQKLEEEKMKREHCETLIQDLQRKLLDQQERLAVAIKVDRNKDAVIIKLRDAWVKLTNGLDRTEDRHKQALDKMNREVEHYKVMADEAQKKTQHYESELYKALDLAHDYQEKCKHFANAHMELKNDMDRTIAHRDEIIRNKDKEIEVLRDNYDTAIRMNKQSTDCVKNIEASCEKEKHEHELTKSKLKEVMLSIQSMQEEINIVKQERDLLKDKLNEERGKWNMAENQLAEKQNQNCELLRKCDTLDSEVKSLRKHLEVQKNELKCHYQRQLEEAVLTKLQEFQQQLQQAEADMINEGKGNERAIIEAFNKQINRIEEQHKLEIKIMEEKHKEEIKLYRLQLTQTNERIESLESKLSTFRERRSQLAEQLHGVMEAQWRQALNILTHPDTSRLHLTRSDAVSSPDPLDYAPPKIPPLVTPSAGRVTSQRRTDRRTDSHLFNFEALSDNELQQYVKLLLTRPPNVSADTDRDMSEAEDRKEVPEEPTSDRPDKDKSKKRGFNSSKPPWKA